MIRCSIILLLLTVTVLAHSQDIPAYAPIRDPREAGEALAMKIRWSPLIEQSDFNGILKIMPRGEPLREVPVRCEVHLDPSASVVTQWTAVYHIQATDSQPAETLRVKFQAGASNEYFYAQGETAGLNLDKLKPMKQEQLLTPLGKSDFWLCDLGLEFLHWPNQKALKTEMRRGRVCRILESANPDLTTAGYARVQSWVDLETGGLLQAEAYDRNGRLIKEFSLGGFKKVDGRWQLKEMKMIDIPNRSRTWLEFDLSE